MLSGLTRILSKIKYWLNKPGTLREQCHGFCLNCPWQELCEADELGLIEDDDFQFYSDKHAD